MTDQKPSYARIYKMSHQERLLERLRALIEISDIFRKMSLAQILRIELFVKGVYERGE